MPHKNLIIRNLAIEIRMFTQRIWVFAGIIILIALLTVFRLIYLQVIQKDVYSTLSKQNRLTLFPIEPTRGLIFDRNGVLIAENNSVFSLEIIPGKIKNIPQALEELKSIIDIDEIEEKEFHKQLKLHRRYEYVIIKQRLSEEEVAKFSVNQHRFPDVAVRARLIRNYPFGSTFAHLLGYVGRINQYELTNLDESNYSGTNFIGKVGIEKFYEEKLHGKTGYEKVETDASGRIIRTIETTPPQQGSNLQLTIDSGLELVAERALEHNRGAIVAIDPNTGEILALVSNPSYDPNLFVNGISNEQMQKLLNSPDQPLFNRSIRGQYPPASTIKPITALEGLDSGVITKTDKIYDPGWYKIENTEHLYRDWNPSGHGWISLHRAITESSDTYFYNLARKLGIKRIHKIMSEFGFGEPAGIDMGEELPGLVPTPKWKKINQGANWYLGDTLITGIGQGYMLSTPLQLASATATLAMRGQRYQPHLLRKEKHADGSIDTPTPLPLAPVLIKNQKNWTTVIKAMQNVIRGNNGTGFRFGRDAQYSVAAKTGTAQVFSIKQGEKYIPAEIPQHLRDHSLFIGFAPAEKPKIAVAIIIENGHNSAGIAREIIDYYLLKDEKNVSRKNS